MKEETFYQAQELMARISELNDAIDKVENEKPASPVINIFLSYVEDTMAVKNSLLKLLKARRNNAKKLFDNLK